MTEENKREFLARFQKHTFDTGSDEVQIAGYTLRIQRITEHLGQNNKSDNSALYGLRQLVSERKKKLKRLLKKNPTRYSSLLKELSIRG